MTIRQKAPIKKAVLLAAAVLAVPGVASADPSGAFYDRSFMLAADARCTLFQPQVNAALTAAAWQARGAALRAGTGEPDLAATAGRARARAAAVSCADPQLATVQRRVQGAFAGWSRTTRMTFDGWVANRIGYATWTWRLMQASVTGASPVTFGYAGQGDAASGDLTAVVSFVGRPRPIAARVVLRDPSRLPRAWLSGAALPPEGARQSLWAADFAPADRTLLTEGRQAGEAWRFSAETAAAIARLDPRERFDVEFHFRDGSMTAAHFTAGDFAAGKAFLAMGML